MTRSDRHASLRSAYLRLNDLGRGLTRAIEGVLGAGLSGNADIAVLGRLQAGPLRPRDLVGMTGLSNAGATSLLDRLEARGLVTRGCGSPDDGRAVVVELTSTGRGLTRAVFSAMCEEFDASVELRLEILRLLGVDLPPRNEMSPGSAVVIDRLAQVGTDVFHAMRIPGIPVDPAPDNTSVVLAAAGGDGVRPRDLIDMTGLSTGGVTLLLDRLEAAGLITRTAGRPPDRRAVIVACTPAGVVALDECLERFATLTEAVAAAIT